MEAKQSERVAPQETAEERQMRQLYSKPPEHFFLEHFRVGDHLHFANAKSDKKSKRGIVAGIVGTDISLLMLGNYKPGTLKVFTFPSSFHYLDVIPQSRRLELREQIEIVGMHVCIEIRGYREMGFVKTRSNGFIELEITQLAGKGQLRRFRESAISNVF